MDNNNRLVATTQNNSAELQFNPVIRTDNGSYQCSAVNVFGSALSQLSIDIIILSESLLMYSLPDGVHD